MSERSNDGVHPSPELKSHILQGVKKGITLDELFGPKGSEKRDHMERVARLKVIGVFREASTPYEAKPRQKPGQPVYTDHYLTGVDDSVLSLSYHIASVMKGTSRFVRAEDLPLKYRQLSSEWRDAVRARARTLLVIEVVNLLVNDDKQRLLWCHRGDMRWQAAQSLIDEYEPLRREIGGFKQGRKTHPRNDNSYHGRPARDRKRLKQNGMATGVSIGGH